MKSFLILLFTLISFLGITQCNNYQIYESFTSTLPTQGGTWTANSMIVLTTPVRTGTHSIGFNGTGDWIRTPQIANPGILSFWYRRSSNTTAWTLNVQTSPDGTTWTTRGSITTVTTTYQQYTLNIGALSLTNVFIRLIDGRASGAQERYVDDLGITSTSSSVNTLIPVIGACSQTLTSTLTYTLSDDGGPAGPMSTGYGNSVNRTITFTPSEQLQGDVVHMTVKGDPFSGATAHTKTIMIKPNNLTVENIFNLEFDEVEKFLLNRSIVPKYTAVFKYSETGGDGKIKNFVKKINWPLIDQWNLDIGTNEFENYLQKLSEIGKIIDQQKTNLISRFLTTNSFKEFDTSDKKMEKILQIYGRSFDEVKKFVDSLSHMTSVN
jgi:hypothetical protein